MAQATDRESRSPRARRVARAARHPVVLLILAALLVADIGSSAITTAHGRQVRAAVYRANAGLHIRFEFDPDDAAISGASRVDGVILFEGIVRRTGVWAPTRESSELRLLEAGNLTAAEQAEILPAMAAAFDRDPDAADIYRRSAALSRAGVWMSSRVLYRGYIHNALSAIAAVWLAAALPLTIRDRVRSARARRRAAAGQCQKCGFDLAGLDGRPCPECGHKIQLPQVNT